MNHFIKLTRHVINKSHIVQIVKSPDTYHIYMINCNRIDGFFAGIIGWVHTDIHLIEISQEKHSVDYHILTEEMNKW